MKSEHWLHKLHYMSRIVELIAPVASALKLIKPLNYTNMTASVVTFNMLYK